MPAQSHRGRPAPFPLESGKRPNSAARVIRHSFFTLAAIRRRKRSVGPRTEIGSCVTPQFGRLSAKEQAMSGAFEGELQIPWPLASNVSARNPVSDSASISISLFTEVAASLGCYSQDPLSRANREVVSRVRRRLCGAIAVSAGGCLEITERAFFEVRYPLDRGTAIRQGLKSEFPRAPNAILSGTIEAITTALCAKPLLFSARAMRNVSPMDGRIDCSFHEISRQLLANGVAALQKFIFLIPHPCHAIRKVTGDISDPLSANGNACAIDWIWFARISCCNPLGFDLPYFPAADLFDHLIGLITESVAASRCCTFPDKSNKCDSLCLAVSGIGGSDLVIVQRAFSLRSCVTLISGFLLSQVPLNIDHQFEKEPIPMDYFRLNFESSMSALRLILRRAGGSHSAAQSYHSQEAKDSSQSRPIRRIMISSSLEMITRTHAYQCTSLTEVIFQRDCHLKVIDGFRECTSLCRIEIPSSVELIREDGFSGCDSLSEVIFAPDSHLKDIDGFSKCISLSLIVIPSSVEIIREKAFWGCNTLNKVLFESPSHLREIHGFQICVALCRIDVPASVEIINRSGFCGCTSLNEVSFACDSHLKRIDGFRRCIALSRITIPSFIDVISAESFFDCRSLSDIVFAAPSQVRAIYGFQGCKLLRRIEIPPSVRIISRWCFHNSPSISEVVFAKGTCIITAPFATRRIFLDYDTDDMGFFRRRVHLWLGS
jgi:hypothetical protein